MKRKVGMVLLVVWMLATIIVSPVYAAPPVLEEWEIVSNGNGTLVVSFIINTTNLKTTQFNVTNYTDYPVYVFVKESGVITWDFLVEGQTVASKSCVLNFQRLPQTDPDDPDSIRYPKNTSLHVRHPAY